MGKVPTADEKIVALIAAAKDILANYEPEYQAWFDLEEALKALGALDVHPRS